MSTFINFQQYIVLLEKLKKYTVNSRFNEIVGAEKWDFFISKNHVFRWEKKILKQTIFFYINIKFY